MQRDVLKEVAFYIGIYSLLITPAFILLLTLYAILFPDYTASNLFNIGYVMLGVEVICVISLAIYSSLIGYNKI